MTGSDPRDAALELCWSLWSELGVPSVVSRHRQVAVDPEPLLLLSSALFRFDPRLRDQVYSWCVGENRRVSTKRLRGLLRTLPSTTREDFGTLAASLQAFDEIRWPSGGGQPWPRRPDVRPLSAQMERPALVRLRARAVCGIGTRADVICELLGRDGRWVGVPDLAGELGQSKRAVRLVLSELREAGMVEAREETGSRGAYALKDPLAWRRLLAASGIAFPRWSALVRLVLRALQLEEAWSKPEAVRRVTANGLRDQLAPVARELGLAAPPTTAGNKAAADDLRSWLGGRLSEIAEGRSPALTSPSR